MINWNDERTKERYSISDLGIGDTFIYQGIVCMKCLNDKGNICIVLLETGDIRQDFDCNEFVDEIVDLDITIKNV